MTDTDERTTTDQQDAARTDADLAEKHHALEMAIAPLDTAESQQVTQVYHESELAGTLDDFNLDNTVRHAVAAGDHLETAKSLEHEKSQDLQHADFAHAGELAGKAAYELQAVDENGRDVSRPVVEAQREVATLGTAAWEQGSAQADHQAALSYASTGDSHTADALDHSADSHAAVAADHAGQAEHSSTDTLADAPTDSSHDVAISAADAVSAESS